MKLGLGISQPSTRKYYATEEQKIDKTVYSTDELQAYAIYKPAVDTYKETKDNATIKYNKELEALELEFDSSKGNQQEHKSKR